MRELAKRIIEFIGILREHGIRIGVSEEIDAVKAAYIALGGEEGEIDTERLKPALEHTLVKRYEDLELFRKLYQYYWEGARRPTVLREARAKLTIVDERRSRNPTEYFLNIYSPHHIEGRKPGELRLAPREKRSISRNMRRLLKKTASTVEGRRRVARSRGDLDFKETIRNSLKTYGELIKLSRTRRKKTRYRLLILLDVSGSMEDHTEQILKMLKTIKTLPPRSYEVFLFSTRIERITEAVARGSEIEKEIEKRRIWGSGTRIGEALHQLTERYSGYLTSKTTVVIVSDGWDLGDLEKLDRSLEKIKKNTSRIIWLTPHGHRESYKPETACLKIASKHIDKLLPLKAIENPRYIRELRIQGNKK